MPLPDRQGPENRGIDWPAVIRILLLQMLVLIALAGAFVSYVNWSSEQAISEFASTSEGSALAPYRQPQKRPSVQAAKDQASCNR